MTARGLGKLCEILPRADKELQEREEEDFGTTFFLRFFLFLLLFFSHSSSGLFVSTCASLCSCSFRLSSSSFNASATAARGLSTPMVPNAGLVSRGSPAATQPTVAAAPCGSQTETLAAPLEVESSVPVGRSAPRTPLPPRPWWQASGSVERRTAARCGASQLRHHERSRCVRRIATPPSEGRR